MNIQQIIKELEQAGLMILDRLKSLVDNEICAYKEFSFQSLYSAIKARDLEEVRNLLKFTDVRENAASHNNAALLWAIEHNYFELVKILLEIPAISERAAIHNNILGLALKINVDSDIDVEFLLNEASANFTPEGYFKLIHSRYVNIAMIAYLLKVPAAKMRAADDDNLVLCWAVNHSEFRIVEKLLDIKCVQQRLLEKEGEQLLQLFENSVDFQTIAINKISIYGMPLSNLLEDISPAGRTDALKSFIKNPIPQLILAAEDGNLELVNSLLANPIVRENATENENEALRLAAQNGHLEVVETILTIPAVKEQAAALGNFALHMAEQYGHSKIADMLRDVNCVREYELLEKLHQTFAHHPINHKSKTLQSIVDNARNDSETLPKHNLAVLKAFKAQKQNQEASKENIVPEGKAAKSSLKRKAKHEISKAI